MSLVTVGQAGKDGAENASHVRQHCATRQRDELSEPGDGCVLRQVIGVLTVHDEDVGHGCVVDTILGALDSFQELCQHTLAPAKSHEHHLVKGDLKQRSTT